MSYTISVYKHPNNAAGEFVVCVKEESKGLFSFVSSLVVDNQYICIVNKGVVSQIAPLNNPEKIIFTQNEQPLANLKIENTEVPKTAEKLKEALISNARQLNKMEINADLHFLDQLFASPPNPIITESQADILLTQARNNAENAHEKAEAAQNALADATKVFTERALDHKKDMEELAHQKATSANPILPLFPTLEQTLQPDLSPQAITSTRQAGGIPIQTPHSSRDTQNNDTESLRDNPKLQSQEPKTAQTQNILSTGSSQANLQPLEPAIPSIVQQTLTKEQKTQTTENAQKDLLMKTPLDTPKIPNKQAQNLEKSHLPIEDVIPHNSKKLNLEVNNPDVSDLEQSLRAQEPQEPKTAQAKHIPITVTPPIIQQASHTEETKAQQPLVGQPLETKNVEEALLKKTPTPPPNVQKEGLEKSDLTFVDIKGDSDSSKKSNSEVDDYYEENGGNTDEEDDDDFWGPFESPKENPQAQKAQELQNRYWEAFDRWALYYRTTSAHITIDEIFTNAHLMASRDALNQSSEWNWNQLNQFHLTCKQGSLNYQGGLAAEEYKKNFNEYLATYLFPLFQPQQQPSNSFLNYKMPQKTWSVKEEEGPPLPPDYDTDDDLFEHLPKKKRPKKLSEKEKLNREIPELEKPKPVDEKPKPMVEEPKPVAEEKPKPADNPPVKEEPKSKNKPKPSTTGDDGIDFTSVPLKKHYGEIYKDNYVPAAKDKAGKPCLQIWPEGKDKGIPINVYKTHMTTDIPADKKFQTKPDGTKELTPDAKKSLDAMADAVIAAAKERIKLINNTQELTAQQKTNQIDKLKNSMWATGDKESIAHLKKRYEDKGYGFKDDPPQAMKDLAKAQEEAAKKAALAEAQKNLGENNKPAGNPLMNMPGFPGG